MGICREGNKGRNDGSDTPTLPISPPPPFSLATPFKPPIQMEIERRECFPEGGKKAANDVTSPTRKKTSDNLGGQGPWQNPGKPWQKKHFGGNFPHTPDFPGVAATQKKLAIGLDTSPGIPGGALGP